MHAARRCEPLFALEHCIHVVLVRTPAQRAGLEDWDLVVMVDGSEDASPAAIRRTLRASKPGDRITLTISRGGKQMEITATLEEADHARMTLLPAGEPGT